MRTLAVIPARYASTRLPGKPLLDICGKPMIQHVCEAVGRASLVDDVLVATDDERIVRAVSNFGGHAVMTSPDCASGTDRLVEIARHEQADIYLNVQGDEPLLRPADVDKLVEALLRHPQAAAATPCYPVSAGQALDPNLVKVVRNEAGQALYFSRAPIPYDRDGEEQIQYWGHVGMYAYRPAALAVFAAHAPGELERAEKLEQLRLLQHGIGIQMVELPPCAPGVDTEKDLERVRALLGGENAENTAGAALSLEERLRRVRLVITDVDGVLTDGGLYYGPDGECLKRFCAQDGLGMVLLRKAGIRVAVLSGRDCPALRRRLADLGISLFRLGKVEKRAACEDLLRESGVSPEESLFLGDDLPDLDGFTCCGLGIAVANARNQVREAAHLVLNAHGGQGAFRELADKLLHARQAE
ncbi:MAG TPA: 3-deoxy-manno-octulosonate cytidylyltransferase [Candidatus Desulfovibrio intestinigallinarum]|nr:3-deoxy-manno-octulosonate cytidylyltransferase [Candidatus Desulfovibrio intestinigallinarum]